MVDNELKSNELKFTNQGIAQSGFAGQGTVLADYPPMDSSDSNLTEFWQKILTVFNYTVLDDPVDL